MIFKIIKKIGSDRILNFNFDILNKNNYLVIKLIK